MHSILIAEHLYKKYGQIVAVDDISIEVRKGEIFGFLGPNGAGKTTAIKMMSGLLKPDNGSVKINCSDGSKSIGVCPQHIVVWENLTCLEQLVFVGQMYDMPTKQAKSRALELLESFGLTEKKDRLAKTLSGGMLRRLNIALALIHSPEIVFLDEPQAGLDPQSRILVREYIKSIKNETTIILTTHDMEEAEKLSDRICIIDKGKLLVSGTTDEIKQMTGLEDLIDISIDGNIQKDFIPFLGNSLSENMSLSGNTASFKITEPLLTLNKILLVVSDQKLSVNNLQLRKKSLEDIFINLTGRSLRE